MHLSFFIVPHRPSCDLAGEADPCFFVFLCPQIVFLSCREQAYNSLYTINNWRKIFTTENTESAENQNSGIKRESFAFFFLSSLCSRCPRWVDILVLIGRPCRSSYPKKWALFMKRGWIRIRMLLVLLLFP